MDQWLLDMAIPNLLVYLETAGFVFMNERAHGNSHSDISCWQFYSFILLLLSVTSVHFGITMLDNYFFMWPFSPVTVLGQETLVQCAAIVDDASVLVMIGLQTFLSTVRFCRHLRPNVFVA